MFVIFTIPVNAQDSEQNSLVIPTFPKCTNPQGQTKVYYATGTHGIPGEDATYTGSDQVFRLTEDTLTQCFCSINDDGIQTNWWKISSLTLDEVEQLVSLGWIYIPNGTLWGLEEEPYMAKNTTYDCSPDKPKDEKEDDDDDDDDDSNDDDNDDEEDDNRIGSILGTSNTRFGDVLGLASTGNIITMVLLSTISGYSFALALHLFKKARKL